MASEIELESVEPVLTQKDGGDDFLDASVCLDPSTAAAAAASVKGSGRRGARKQPNPKRKLSEISVTQDVLPDSLTDSHKEEVLLSETPSSSVSIAAASSKYYFIISC